VSHDHKLDNPWPFSVLTPRRAGPFSYAPRPKK
jgi:hypothetical protein